MKQSLINEHKGFVFEYLVAHYFAEESEVGLGNFLSSIESQDFERLNFYQKNILANDKTLYKQLPLLAKEVCHFYLNKFSQGKLQSVALTSRSKLLSDNADIILEFKQHKSHLSLKLCKDLVFVNTKSAGIKSFLSKYFLQAFENQHTLNQHILQAFEKLRFSLLDHYGYELTDKVFEQWQLEGMATTPGGLDVNLRNHLIDYYHLSITAIYEQVKILFDKDPPASQKTFIELCGLSYGAHHLFCFHQGTDSYELAKISDLKSTSIEQEIPEILPPARGSSYFLINYSLLSLQIRVKPMRDFTAQAMKINCSIKFKPGHV